MEPAWISQIYNSAAWTQGKPMRRKIASVTKHASEADLIASCKARNLILIKTPTQYVIFPTTTTELLVGP